MTVKELIEELQVFPEEIGVRVACTHLDGNGVARLNIFSVVGKGFFDAPRSPQDADIVDILAR